MSDDELYDFAVREYQGRNWQGWLTAQSDQSLLRLYAGLSRAKAHTLVIRTPAERAAAETHTGRVVIRDEQGSDEMYPWDDYCTDCCVLDDVTQTLGGRLYNRVVGTQDTLAVALEALPTGGLRVLTDYPAVISRRVESWMRHANDSGETLAA
ncbi:MAG: hypothetical protein K2V38_06095 [Gemmataceae bacterium]|nr:hypothetical protein [Gemmataceae bacterium]